MTTEEVILIQRWTNVRTDWVLNDDNVLDGGSDCFCGIWAKSEMEEQTVGDYK